MIVIGGGIIGLTCAWRLSQAGREVEVYEAKKCGGEASWAAAGMLAPGGEMESRSPLGEMMLASLRQYPKYIQELQAESGRAIDYRQVGALEVAFDDAGAEELDRKATRQAGIGILSEPATHNGYYARFYPEDALVDPREIVAALLEALRRRGVAIREGSGAVSVWPDGSGFDTSKGGIRAEDGLLVAAGAWSGGLHAGLTPTFPVKGHLASWTFAPGLIGPILRNGHTYVMQRANGTVLAGSNEERAGFHRTVRKSAIEDLRKRAARLLPALADRAPEAEWTGFRPGIEADQPFIGRIPGTPAFGAFGHYRNGILLAPETGSRLMAALA